MIGIRRTAVHTTYRGYTLIIDVNDVLAIAPNGDTHCQPSMSTIRRWINQHRTLSEREPQATPRLDAPTSQASSRSPNVPTHT
jgi:hypothetical protein